MKFCYVDFLKETDVNDVFTHYKKNLIILKNKRPDIKFVHFTVPLMKRSAKASSSMSSKKTAPAFRMTGTKSSPACRKHAIKDPSLQIRFRTEPTRWKRASSKTQTKRAHQSISAKM